MADKMEAYPNVMEPSDFDDLPRVKRLKTEDREERRYSTSSSESTLQLNTVEGTLEPERHPEKVEISDSEAEDDSSSDDEPSYLGHQTELENALPAVKTDKQAIAEYELLREAKALPSDVQDRLNSRQWAKGKSSIYVDAFFLAMETVLQEEAHLFDEPELAVFQCFRELDYDSQYLYVRLFLRKTAAWHRLSRLGYWDDVADLTAAAASLQLSRLLPNSSAEVQMNPGETEAPINHNFGESFTFADTSETDIDTLEEASTLLNLDELKGVAKEAKVQGKNKTELLKAFRHVSSRQSGLASVGLVRTDSEMSTGSSGSNGSNVVVENFDDKNRDKHFLRKILASTGPCIRLSTPVSKLFERVHLVFYRSTEWTDKSLTTIILARISRRTFPDYVVSRSADTFPTRQALLEFEAALRTQFRVDNILELNGNPGLEGLKEVLKIYHEVYPRWKSLLKVEQAKEDRVYESGEGAYLRRFSPAWIYTRIIHKATSVLGKLKRHEEECEVLGELLNQRLFHAARRGSWYQRRALLEEHYMADLKPTKLYNNPEQQKKHWKRISLKTCEDGLRDRDVHVIYHYDLQKRIRKLEKAMKLPKREQHEFHHVGLVKPAERNVEGIRIQKEYDKPKRNKLGEERPRSTKTIWVDEAEGGGECSVEEMCLSFYRTQDKNASGMATWKGYHAEGGIIRSLFAFLFYDILFIYIPNVFQTAYQTCPLDLHTDAFYISRFSEINRRLMEISNGEAHRLIQEVDSREREKRTSIVGLNWDFTLEDLLEIASCFPGPALAMVCKVMAQEYQQRGGGIPDLFLWNCERKEVLFAEVKSENDRLSDTQRLWIHVLTGAGIRVELCNAVAKEVRLVRCEK